ncbi:hypothetical protein P10159_0923 [Citrobacter portucalensis]|nr:hypothetical protein P10159_0923 [Citrobacter portucalensis]
MSLVCVAFCYSSTLQTKKPPERPGGGGYVTSVSDSQPSRHI